MPLLLPGAPQSDPGSYLHLVTRKTHLVPGYVRLSDDHRSPLLGTRPRMPPCKAGGEKGPRVLLPEARKSFYLQFCHDLPEQGKFSSSSLICQELFPKSSPSPTSKKQPNTPQVDLSSKLVSNGKLTSDEHKKCLKNNLCLYCGAGDHKLDSCPKKQTTVSPKDHSASATADTLAAASKKPSEK